MKARNFGIELEFTDRSRHRTKGISRTNLLDLCNKVIPKYDKINEVSGHERKDKWTVKYDGSCGNELTSPVLPLTQVTISKITKILNDFNESFGENVPITSHCGFHVHFDISDLDLETLKKVVWIFYNLEKSLFGLYPKSRYNGSYTAALKQSYFNPDKIKRNFSYFRDEDYVINNHYSCFNTSRYCDNRKTCEIRHAEGTSDPEDVICWILLCALIIESAKKNVIPQEDSIDELKGFITKNAVSPTFRRHNKRIVDWVDQRSNKYARQHANR